MRYTYLLKLILATAVAGWGVSLLFVFLPWPMATTALEALGAGAIPADPMADYWLRMAGGGFTMVAVMFALPLFWPARYGVLLAPLAWLSLAEGVVVLVSGLRLGLPAFPMWGDVAFSLGVGGAMLVLIPLAAREGAVASGAESTASGADGETG